MMRNIEDLRARARTLKAKYEALQEIADLALEMQPHLREHLKYRSGPLTEEQRHADEAWGEYQYAVHDVIRARVALRPTELKPQLPAPALDMTADQMRAILASHAHTPTIVSGEKGE